MVSQFFSPMDAATILSIPLSYQLPCDRMVQAFTPKGNFTIRSAYRLALDMVNSAANREASDNHQRSLFWKTLWHLNVPNKIKSFAWRASKNILPTKDNLCRRKVIDVLTCEACGFGVESTGHVFWECEKAQEVWVLSSIPFDPPELLAPNFMDFLLLLKFRQKMGDELLELMVMVAWCLWFNCNEVRQGKAQQLGFAILSKARYLLDEFQMANLKLSQTNRSTKKPREDLT